MTTSTNPLQKASQEAFEKLTLSLAHVLLLVYRLNVQVIK